MQLGLDCHSSAAPHSATLVPAFQENREALMAVLSERVQEPDEPTEFIHYSKQGLSQKTSTQHFTHTRNAPAILCLLLNFHGWCLLCQLFHQYKGKGFKLLLI